ncbi:MAG: hypothetical protein JNL41_07135 [Phenylobacterium sp.]|uniref:hypothetical protein n=1 Tax=Phenylobacterium sp. TaxID=1871053 RepID=UPI001A38D1D2|nr:hypothetical protein [Phenylobacterium sp.]MBL8554035.1 hypothetical protein [Phenylobacterium sp.]
MSRVLEMLELERQSFERHGVEVRAVLLTAAGLRDILAHAAPDDPRLERLPDGKLRVFGLSPIYDDTRGPMLMDEIELGNYRRTAGR